MQINGKKKRISYNILKKIGPLKILAFDTSTHLCTVAVLEVQNRLDQGDVREMQAVTIHTIQQSCDHRQSQFILPMIQQLLMECSLNWHSLDAYAYGNGPGSSFTGIRVACSVAQAAGFVLSKPVFPISSLAILAQSLYLEKTMKNIGVCIESSVQNLVHFAYYQYRPQYEVVQLMGEERIAQPLQCSSFLQEMDLTNSQDSCGVGKGWLKTSEIGLQKALQNHLPLYTDCLPSAIAVAQLAMVAFMAHPEGVVPEKALPHYLEYR